MEEKSAKLVVGLGNPGLRYIHTRHNLGFLVLDAFAKEHQLEFKKNERFSGEIAQLDYHGEKVYLLKPHTYMNLSGKSVKKCLDFYKIKVEQTLIVVDDIALDFGALMMKPKGGSGGHQGLKNIEGHIGSFYPRLKMGIGQPTRVALEDYVLENFDAQETAKLGHFIDQGVQALTKWIELGLEKAMNVVNTKLD